MLAKRGLGQSCPGHPTGAPPLATGKTATGSSSGTSSTAAVPPPLAGGVTRTTRTRDVRGQGAPHSRRFHLARGSALPALTRRRVAFTVVAASNRHGQQGPARARKYRLARAEDISSSPLYPYDARLSRNSHFGAAGPRPPGRGRVPVGPLEHDAAFLHTGGPFIRNRAGGTSADPRLVNVEAGLVKRRLNLLMCRSVDGVNGVVAACAGQPAGRHGRYVVKHRQHTVGLGGAAQCL